MRRDLVLFKFERRSLEFFSVSLALSRSNHTPVLQMFHAAKEYFDYILLDPAYLCARLLCQSRRLVFTSSCACHGKEVGGDNDVLWVSFE